MQRDPEGRRQCPPWVGWQALTAATSAALTTVVYLVTPHYFYRGDKQDQYVPALRDIGRRLRAGEWLPAIDPALGQAGNYALDIQYGLFDPSHWLVALALSTIEDAGVATWLWSSAYLVLLACGVCAVALRLRAAGSWAATAGVAAAFSGFVMLWLAPSWIPGLMSLAWVPWWWWAVLPRHASWPRLVAAGVFAYLVVAGGWPATWVILAALALGVVVESRFVRRRWPNGATLPAVLASAGGVVAATAGLVPLLLGVEATYRTTGLLNDGFLVPNLADVLAFSAPLLYADIKSFDGYSVGGPYFFGAWFAVVVAWSLRWNREALCRPGVVTCLVAGVTLVLLTQASSELGPLRWPIRFLPGVHLVLAVGTAVLAHTGALRFSRIRAYGAGATLAVVCVLTFFRRPDDLLWLASTVLLAVVAGALLVALRTRGGRYAGAAALATTTLLAGLIMTTHSEYGVHDEGYPSRPTAGILDFDAEPGLALYPDEGNEGAWYRQGVGVGLSRLSPTERMQPGYSSVSQGAWRERFCMLLSDGSTCPAAVDALFDVEPTTGQVWADLLGYRQIAVHRGDHLRRWREEPRAGWVASRRTEDFVLFSRTAALPTSGRVTATVGEASVRAEAVARARQSYRVSSPDGATLVFRDHYWPGYVATLDGEELPVGALADMLVSVEVPPETEGTLRLEYVALPAPAWAGLVGGGVLLVLVAVAVHRGRGRGTFGRPGQG